MRVGILLLVLGLGVELMWRRHYDLSESDKLGAVSPMGHTVWSFLLAHPDMLGRFSADPEVVKSKCMTKCKWARLEQVETALIELNDQRLIHLYEVRAKRYLVLHDVDEHNPPGRLSFVRKSKHPAPPVGLCSCLQFQKGEEGFNDRVHDRVDDQSISSSTSKSESTSTGGVSKEGGNPSENKDVAELCARRYSETRRTPLPINVYEDFRKALNTGQISPEALKSVVFDGKNDLEPPWTLLKLARKATGKPVDEAFDKACEEMFRKFGGAK